MLEVEAVVVFPAVDRVGDGGGGVVLRGVVVAERFEALYVGPGDFRARGREDVQRAAGGGAHHVAVSEVVNSPERGGVDVGFGGVLENKFPVDLPEWDPAWSTGTTWGFGGFLRVEGGTA